MAARGKSRFFRTNPAEAMRPAQKLFLEDFATFVTSHGPVLRAGAKERLYEAVELCRY
ncbi:MAG TPA: hypothetical protein VFI90_12355 [Rubrobacter sp.]|nr:hypothetical protein [Rubrobacter sp.]